MNRRGFFKRAAAFLGIAVLVKEAPAQSNGLAYLEGKTLHVYADGETALTIVGPVFDTYSVRQRTDGQFVMNIPPNKGNGG